MTGAYNYYCCVENCTYYLHAGVQTFRADVWCDEVCVTTLLCPPQITCSFSRELHTTDFLEMFVFSHGMIVGCNYW